MTIQYAQQLQHERVPFVIDTTRIPLNKDLDGIWKSSNGVKQRQNGCNWKKVTTGVV